MLPCKQTGCCWHLAYLDCSPSYSVATSYHQKSTKNVQDCILSRRIARQLVQSDDGLRRSPADGARPHRDTQRRPSLFRPLIPKAAAFQGCFPRLLSKAAFQGCFPRLLSKAAFQGCFPRRLLSRAAAAERPPAALTFKHS